MAWRVDEVWLDAEMLWFREPTRPLAAPPTLAVPAFVHGALEPALFAPIPTGLDESQRRRLTARTARRRRLATRTVPAVALVLGSATMLPIGALRHGGGGAPGPLLEDPPSLTFRSDDFGFRLPRAPARAPRAEATRAAVKATELARIQWHQATSIGLPYSGRLAHGTQLPLAGADWTTWDPVTDSTPNRPDRLYGNERTIRTIVSVIAAYRSAHPHAPRVVVGDISYRGGGRMDEHVSHQNGLDVDVYYPRRDGHLSAPIATSQIDQRLAQDLLDRFVAAGAQIVFVGYSTGLRGPSGVVVPYPNHENHMHVRFPHPG